MPGEASGIGTRYRTTIVGRTTVIGEVDRITSDATDSPARVIEFLTLGEGATRRIPRASRLALSQAGEYDRPLAVALSRFNHPSNERHR